MSRLWRHICLRTVSADYVYLSVNHLQQNGIEFRRWTGTNKQTKIHQVKLTRKFHSADLVNLHSIWWHDWGNVGTEKFIYFRLRARNDKNLRMRFLLLWWNCGCAQLIQFHRGWWMHNHGIRCNGHSSSNPSKPFNNHWFADDCIRFDRSEHPNVGPRKNFNILTDRCILIFNCIVSDYGIVCDGYKAIQSHLIPNEHVIACQ